MERHTLGDYELLNQIDNGPLGVTYHAQHRFLKRFYALRILPDELAHNRNFIERFEKEVGNLAALHHENLVRIHNISESGGKHYIVSDLVLDDASHYTTLSAFLQNLGTSTNEETLFSILYQIASALDYLHQNGMIHRALNLSSIVVGKKEGGVLQVYLQDSGIAHILGEGNLLFRTYQNMSEGLMLSELDSDIKGAQITQLHEAFFHSYPFLAPEQRKMERGSLVTKQADTFAFGILAYYLLLREYPEGFFALPSANLPLQFNWDQLIFACLNKDPKKRPESILEQLKGVKGADPKEAVIDQWKLTSSVTIEEQVKDRVAPVKPASSSIKDIVKEIKEEKVFETPTANPIEANISLTGAAQTTPFQAEQSATALQEELKPKLNPTEIEKPHFEPDPSVIFQSETEITAYKPVEPETVELSPIDTKMVVVEGADYYRGSNEGARDEKPYHKIRLNSFAIDEHPCTNEQFVRFLEVMGGEKDSNNCDMIRLRESKIKKAEGHFAIESGYANHPVVGVTWYGALAYAKWVGKRLPTEAEWEIAARSKESDMLYPTGASIEKNQANFFSADTTAVKEYEPNEMGLYDMAGNVYEWCDDWYDYAYYDVSEQEPENPKGPVQGVYRVLRGGCWKSLKDDLRCSHRHRNNPGAINKTYGFRCAADVT